MIEWYRSNPEQMQNVEMGVLEDQVVNLILDQSAIEEVVASYADVLSGAAIATLTQTQGVRWHAAMSKKAESAD